MMHFIFHGNISPLPESTALRTERNERQLHDEVFYIF